MIIPCLWKKRWESRGGGVIVAQIYSLGPNYYR